MVIPAAPWYPGGPGWVAWAVPASFVAAAGAIVAGTSDGPVLCPWRLATGSSCPGCGTTRATSLLLRGDLAGSWGSHPIVLLVAVQAVVLAVLALLPTTAGRGRSLAGTDGRWLAAANSALVAALWLLRVASGASPTSGA